MNSKRLRVTTLSLFCFTALAGNAYAQLTQSESDAPVLSDDGVWTALDQPPAETAQLAPWVRPDKGAIAVVDTDALQQSLADAPLEFTADAQQRDAILWLPTPDGDFKRFKVVESPIMAPELAERYPWIKTYWAQGLDEPRAPARLDWTHHGFHAQIISPEGTWYIDPYSRGDVNTYSVYYKRDLHYPDENLTCDVIVDPNQDLSWRNHDEDDGNTNVGVRTGSTLYTYSLAVAATGEYTAYHGGTKADGQAAIVTAVNRIDGIYENDLTVRLILVANNDDVVYTNAGTDPYTNGNESTMLSEVRSNLNSVIGSSNYDVGHVLGTGGGGVAYLGCVCTTNKARGVSTSFAPTGDGFHVDYVAHEMGHQFGGSHSFNGISGSCSGNRSSSDAYERGSGTTIMAYAGVCSSDDVQPHSDAYFHIGSIIDMRSFIESTSCDTSTSTGNNSPSVNAGANYTIPKNTPFTLDAASSSDPDGDSLTYCWEEIDLGPAQALSAADNGSSPLMRSRSPRTSTARTFPRLPDIRNNVNDDAEVLPKTNRTMQFRCTVRDNHAGGGGVQWDTMNLTIDAGSGPFRVTSPNTNVTWSGTQTVTWNVNGTDGAPVNTALVNILLSDNDGQTFPTVLVANTPNDGSENVTLPNISTSSARIKVEAVGNVYFDMSDDAFTIEASCAGDLDDSGTRDLTDLGILLGDWGSPCITCDGDMDDDGNTDLTDLGIFLGYYGMPCP